MCKSNPGNVDYRDFYLLAVKYRIMPKEFKIYTKTGDDGTTGLVGGTRVKKYAPRLEAYGTIDRNNFV